MTEEPNKEEQAPIAKLLFDEPSNFQFHAAYLVYSDLFDDSKDEAVQKELNTNMEALKKNEIDCQTFYMNIAHHRKTGPAPRQGMYSVQTQRKRDWRAKEQKHDRIRRHKK
ncbi:MAG TPA: hypothetical protein VF893_02705 [Candidatus Bathyarchaeia archaeon]